MTNSLSPILLDLGQGGCRLILTPARIAQRAKEYQLQFDQWLTAPASEHSYWVASPDGTPALCYDGAEAFVRWLNEFVLTPDETPASVVPVLPVLHF